jgi:hypothetical protein
MRHFRNFLLCAALLTCISTSAIASASVKVSAECVRRNAPLFQQIARGQLDDAKRSVAESLQGDGGEPLCAGLLLNNLAAGLQVAGRLDEARTFADRAIECYQRSLPADDPTYLRPLQIVATVDLLQGMTGRAREVFRRMQVTRVGDSSDRLLLLWISGSLLEREGRKQEAELALIDARSALADAGRENSADAASIWGQLARLYLHEQRYGDAGAAVNSALTILNLAADATAFDRIKLLNTRATVWSYENRWRDAERDLAGAVSLARQQPKTDPLELEQVLKNYAYVLRKLRRREARSVERWAETLRSTNAASRQVIDVTELAANGSADR